MSFQLSEVTATSDFEELIKVEWEAYENPFAPLIRLFFPIFGNSLGARKASLQESTNRQVHWHETDPSSHWLRVTDSTTGNIVGAADWNLFEANPYATESDEECTWFKEGEDREVANLLMGQFMTPRVTYMAKPHVFLNICLVHPQYRRRGIGSMMVKWGLEKADERGVETYIDAFAEGLPLYKTYGFLADKSHSLDPSPAKPTERWWNEIANRQKMLPMHWTPMWRPALAKFTDDTSAPWEKQKS
ncbi:MAG: hypothetical protein Q9160_003380 [Pyrenula sp. 1 TL-2023]